jgi:GAF domain-containing protein
VVRAAVDVTAASAGWVMGRTADGARLQVVAAASQVGGTIDISGLVGSEVAADAGTAGFVLASGQPLALSSAGADPRPAEGIPGLLGHRPATVLCIACEVDEGVLGVIELVDKGGGSAFSFDDVEFATVLAGIAGAALEASGTTTAAVAAPAALGLNLQRLADADPARYGVVAAVVTTLLERD